MQCPRCCKGRQAAKVTQIPTICLSEAADSVVDDGRHLAVHQTSLGCCARSPGHTQVRTGIRERVRHTHRGGIQDGFERIQCGLRLSSRIFSDPRFPRSPSSPSRWTVTLSLQITAYGCRHCLEPAADTNTAGGHPTRTPRISSCASMNVGTHAKQARSMKSIGSTIEGWMTNQTS